MQVTVWAGWSLTARAGTLTVVCCQIMTPPRPTHFSSAKAEVSLAVCATVCATVCVIALCDCVYHHDLNGSKRFEHTHCHCLFLMTGPKMILNKKILVKQSQQGVVGASCLDVDIRSVGVCGVVGVSCLEVDVHCVCDVVGKSSGRSGRSGQGRTFLGEEQFF
jgi:hypothetical protein